MLKNRKTMVTAGHFHAVRFYTGSAGLCRIVADFLIEGLTAGQPGVIIATPSHLAGVEALLAAHGLDLNQCKARGDLFVLDAEETLAAFMVDGNPDPARFRAAMIPVLDQASGDRGDRTVRAYGEMVDVLWKSGRTIAATRLETLWNTLANSHSFSLLCGYALGSFYKDAAISDVCAHHTHIVSDAGEVAPAH